MHLLLLNNNPAVSRLIKLSVDKVGYALDEFEDYGLVPIKHYDLIMVDNECCDEEELATLCDNASCQYVLYIAQRGAQKPDFANAILEKPFLPTDFLSLLEKIKNVLESLKPEPVQEEIDLSEEEASVPLEEEQSFDIDAIDTFGVEDDGMVATPTSTPDDDTNAFEELSLENDDPLEEEDSFETQMPSLKKEDDEEADSFALPTFDLDANAEDDELELPFIHEQASIEQSPSVGLLENSDDFETEELLPEKEVLSEPTILDKDDINEVKQLLDDDEEEFSLEDKLDIHADEAGEEEHSSALEELSLEEEEEAPLSFEDVPEELSFGLGNAHEEEEEEVLPPTQDEMIDDFEEVIEERIEEERLEPVVDVSMNEVVLPVAKEFDSLDDLNENAIKRAFGEEVEEEIAEEMPVAEEKAHDVEVIRGEIESTIAHSLSTLAQSDILREALKGMRINISITFDEKN